MRMYSIAVTALAVDAPIKWIDNLLSQHAIDEVVSAQRGVARLFPYSSVVRVAIIRLLHTQLGMSVADAVRTTASILGPGTAGAHETALLRLTVDLPALEHTVNAKLSEALESMATPRRGRPPGTG
jgi:hypothetical protein